MATTTASLVRDIRNLLEDRPQFTQLNDGAGINASVTTMTVDDAAVIRRGVAYEFDDGSANNAEVVMSMSTGTLTPTIIRAWEGSTAATHADNVVIWVDPLYRYNKIALAINKVINTDLFGHLYEIVEHQVTSSTTADRTYNAPSTACESILNIYQDTSSTYNTPKYLEDFEQYRNVDTALFSNGKYFRVFGGTVDGTTVFYVNCAHPLQTTTLTDPQADVVRYLAAAHLLEWGEPRATVDQNERKARVGDRARLAAYFRSEGKAMLRREAAKLQKLAPPRKEFRRRRPPLVV